MCISKRILNTTHIFLYDIYFRKAQKHMLNSVSNNINLLNRNEKLSLINPFVTGILYMKLFNNTTFNKEYAVVNLKNIIKFRGANRQTSMQTVC